MSDEIDAERGRIVRAIKRLDWLTDYQLRVLVEIVENKPDPLLEQVLRDLADAESESGGHAYWGW